MVPSDWRKMVITSAEIRASEINNYPKIAQDFGPDTRRFE
jgi:hypothetical protein